VDSMEPGPLGFVPTAAILAYSPCVSSGADDLNVRHAHCSLMESQGSCCVKPFRRLGLYEVAKDCMWPRSS
jgi:hypothetical protein